jgi:hypothetical protein
MVVNLYESSPLRVVFAYNFETVGDDNYATISHLSFVFFGSIGPLR